MNHSTPSSPVWRLELLGGLRARRLDLPGEAPLEKFRTQKTASLLALLALNRARHSRESLGDALWPESEPESARNSLRVALSALRTHLEPPGVAHGAALEVARDGIALGPGVVTDVELFLTACKTASAAQGDSGNDELQALEAAFSHYGGPLLHGYSPEWLVSEDSRLEEAYLNVVARLITLLEAGDQPVKALDVARRAVAAAPLREEALQHVLRLGFKLGQNQSVLREFEAWQKRAKRSGGAASEATLELVQRARSLEPELESNNGVSPPEPVAPHVEKQADQRQAFTPHPSPRGRALPGQWTNFFGRETELEALRNWLGDAGTRLVTLSGPGGAGKTRLALELGRRLNTNPKIEALGAHYSHFSLVAWVALADLREAHLIPGAILHALAQPRSDESLGAIVDALREVLKDAPQGRLLLIFDNFEHLCDEGGPLVRELLDQVPELVCLVTSRRRLGYGGEQEWALQPLETPDPHTITGDALPASVQLFLDRARFPLTPANREAVFGICARLEGLPLALELAAARVSLFSPEQILAGLNRQLKNYPLEPTVTPPPLELPEVEDFAPAPDTPTSTTPTSLDWTNHDRAAPSRHHSLRATIEWSQGQLAPRAARFWGGLSAFRGGWTLDAATYVCNEPDAGSLMLALRDVSLISLDKRSEPPRGSQLEAIREYASEGLSPLDREALATRHARYYLNWAESIAPHLNGPRGPRYLARFEAEHDNLRLALEWHLEHDIEGALRFGRSLWWAWELRGHLTEGLMVLRQIVKAAQRAYPEAQAEALQDLPGARERLGWLAHTLNGAGKLATIISHLEEARDYYQKALLYFGTLKDDIGIADSLYGLGYTHLKEGDLDGARDLCDQSIAIYRNLGEAGKRSGLCDALHNRALVAIYDGDLETVQRLNNEQLSIHRPAGESRGVAVTLESLGLAALFSGEFETAGNYFRESLALFESIGELRSASRVLWGLGHVARAASQEAVAIEAFSRALRLARDTQTLWTLPYMIEGFVYLAAEKNQWRLATRLASGAALLRETHQEPLPRLMFLQELDSIVATLSEALGTAAFENEWMQGRALSREALIALALEGGERVKID